MKTLFAIYFFSRKQNKFTLDVIHNIPYFVLKMDLNSKIDLNSV